MRAAPGAPKKRLLDAADMGVAAADPDDLQRHRAKAKEAQKRYNQKHNKLVQGRLRREIEIKPGTPTWIDDGDWSAAMRRAFITRRALRVTDISRARVFVVRDVVAPPRLVSFAASLIGGLVVSTTFFADPPGPVIVYDRALRLTRRVWISPACTETSPRTIDLLKQHVARARSESQGTRWNLISWEEFSERAARARNQHRRSSELVALVTAGEMGVLSEDQRRHAQTLSRFASGVKRLRLSEGLAGVCGQ